MILMKTLSEKLEAAGYHKLFWIKNYLKTVLTSTLISSGVGLIITGELTRMKNRGWSSTELQLGVLCIIAAAIGTYIIDKYLSKKEKEKEAIIEEHINEKAQEIAENKILNAMKNLEE